MERSDVENFGAGRIINRTNGLLLFIFIFLTISTISIFIALIFGQKFSIVFFLNFFFNIIFGFILKYSIYRNKESYIGLYEECITNKYSFDKKNVLEGSYSIYTTPTINYNLTYSNIKSIRLASKEEQQEYKKMKSMGRDPRYYFVDSLKKMVCIEFKEPIEFILKHVIIVRFPKRIREMKTLSKLYLSVKEPMRLIESVNKRI